MKESRIFELLRSFSKAEVRKFRSFLLSPYFNRSEKVVKLYDGIIKHYPSFHNSAIFIKTLHKRITQTREFKASTYRELISQLTELAFNFISLEESLKNKSLTNYLLMENIRERGLDGLYKLLMKRLRVDSYENDIDVDFLYYKFLMESSIFNWSVQFDKVIKKAKAVFQFQHLNKASLYLTIFYLTEIISEHIASLIYSEKYNIVKNECFVEKLLEKINIDEILRIAKSEGKYEGIIDLYSGLLSMFADFEDTEKFYAYKKVFLKHQNKLSNEEKSFHLSKLISYSLLKTKQPLTQGIFELELFELYQILLKTHYNGVDKTSYFPPNLFRDILLLSLKLTKYQWAENFLNEYSKFLTGKEREALSNLGYSFYYFSICKFDKALECLNRISYDYFILKYDVKNLKLKIFYELGCNEEILCLIDAYKESLIRDHMLNDFSKKKYKNFISILEKLVKYRENGKKLEKSVLIHDLRNGQNIIYKDWLIKKIEEIDTAQ